jgi:enoyl-CoA hydratase/carnithine racemase
MTAYETVEYTLLDGVATARMNQPESLNAMTMPSTARPRKPARW